MKKIYLLAVGGTISYAKGHMQKNGEQILSEAGLSREAYDVTVWDVLHKASSDMKVEDLFFIAKQVNKAVREGAEGIVVSQGTDTIEETAFFLELTVASDVPVIVTGAMRHTGLLGADGGANIKAAVIAAASDRLRGEGCCVAFDEKFIPAWYVRKTNTQSLDTFQSQFGPIGYISEGKLRIVAHCRKPEGNYKFSEEILDRKPAEVYVHAVNIGDDGRVLEYVRNMGYGGVVLEGLGGGHCTAEMAAAAIRLNREIPVIMSSRTGSGEVLADTYAGYPGSEAELRKNGILFSGILDARKTRILLILFLTKGLTQKEIASRIKGYTIFD